MESVVPHEASLRPAAEAGLSKPFMPPPACEGWYWLECRSAARDCERARFWFARRREEVDGPLPDTGLSSMRFSEMFQRGFSLLSVCW